MMPQRDRGTADALGLVVLAPVAIGLALTVVWLGRAVDVDAQLRTAAEAAAQAGALERTHTDATLAAERTVEAMLGGKGACDGATTLVPQEPHRGVGMASGLIEVTVVCTIDRSVLPSRRARRSATAWATVDRFRVVP